jgi:hypothetical protein
MIVYVAAPLPRVIPLRLRSLSQGCAYRARLEIELSCAGVVPDLLTVLVPVGVHDPPVAHYGYSGRAGKAESGVGALSTCAAGEGIFDQERSVAAKVDDADSGAARRHTAVDP